MNGQQSHAHDYVPQGYLKRFSSRRSHQLPLPRPSPGGRNVERRVAYAEGRPPQGAERLLLPRWPVHAHIRQQDHRWDGEAILRRDWRSRDPRELRSTHPNTARV